MKNREVTRIEGGFKKIFTRHDRREVRTLFEAGETITIMAADRDPATSPTTGVDYTRGGELFYYSPDIATDFDKVLGDFAEWLANDGYDHCPDLKSAHQQRFSYWTWHAIPNWH